MHEKNSVTQSKMLTSESIASKKQVFRFGKIINTLQNLFGDVSEIYEQKKKHLFQKFVFKSRMSICFCVLG